MSEGGCADALVPGVVACGCVGVAAYAGGVRARSNRETDRVVQRGERTLQHGLLADLLLGP